VNRPSIHDEADRRFKNHLDLASAMLADDGAAWRERAIRGRAQLRVYREIAQQAFHSLRDWHVRFEQLESNYHRALDELRALRKTSSRRPAA
jgi:hypothetical protein